METQELFPENNRDTVTNNEVYPKVVPQKLYIMKHGERIDFTFGVWIPYCFDESGKYTRKDLNMPPSLPYRANGSKGYLTDTPITQLGIFQATAVGEDMKQKDLAPTIQHVFCSPAFRSIQTCDAFLKGLGIKENIKIRVEPGLFEWLSWYPDSLPDWMTVKELIDADYNIDTEYSPYITRNELIKSHKTRESCEQFYMRCALVTEKILASCSTGDILFVAHGPSLDVCSRKITGKGPRNGNDMTNLIQRISYCSLATLVKTNDKWEFTEPPCPPLTNLNNPRFDWRALK